MRTCSLPKVYVDPGFKGIPKIHLSERVYADSILKHTVLCVDAAVCHSTRQTLWLAPRITRPMKDTWWWIGGKGDPGEPPKLAMSQVFKRETGLKITTDRFHFLGFMRYFFADREQEPQDIGCDSLVHQFAVELTEEELGATRLVPTEYGGYLREFGWDDLVTAGVPEAVLDVYQMIFQE